MAKVLMRSTKRPGTTKRVDARLAAVLVKRGWEYVEEQEREPTQEVSAGQYQTRNQAPDYNAMSYADLRALARERGVEPEGRTKADYVEALSSPGRYLRRDMRAEE